MSRPPAVNALKRDSALTAEQLDDKYGQDGKCEHPVFTRSDWCSDTPHISYWSWVASELESEFR
jgi:hypothetical protein